MSSERIDMEYFDVTNEDDDTSVCESLFSSASSDSTYDEEKDWEKYQELHHVRMYDDSGNLSEKIISDSEIKKIDGIVICYNKFGKIIYNGNFKNGEYNGNGVEYYYDETIMYSGFYKNGSREGYGVMFDAGSILYKGNFKEGMYDGYGLLYNNDYEDRYLLYDGYFENDLKSGKGKEYYPNGNVKYKGEYKEDKFHGKGQLYYSNGKKEYCGTFKDGKYDTGRLYKNGIMVYKGSFKNNKFHGSGTLYVIQKRVNYTGEFKNGKCVDKQI